MLGKFLLKKFKIRGKKYQKKFENIEISTNQSQT